MSQSQITITLEEVKGMSSVALTKLVEDRSQLYTKYGVTDNDGKFRDVIDVQSVVELLQEILE